MSIKSLTSTQAKQLLDQPGAVPWHINGARSQVWYRVLTEQQLYDSAFLDQRLALGQDESLFSIPLAAVLNHQQAADQPSNWIFHTSFCCSTLLARLLQVDEQVLSVKEPLVLNQLAAAFRQQPERAAQHAKLFGQIAGQLEKPFRPGQVVILKTSNYMNALLNQVQQINRKSRVLLVWGGLKSFIRSMLKNRDEAAKTMPVFLQALIQDVPIKTDYIPGTDFWHDVAHLWGVQIILFANFLANTELEVATVRKRAILADTETVVAACDQFFCIKTNRAEGAIAEIMRRDSKRQGDKPSVTMNNIVDKEEQMMVETVNELALELIPKNALSILEANQLSF